MSSGSPKVSVVMGLHNAEDFVAESVQSILAQDFRDFEFLIYDDASTDRSSEIVRRFGDERIRLFHESENIGLTRVLNKALAASRGEYIARMDADDVAVPSRLHKQVALLESSPATGVCAMWYQRFSNDRRETVKCPVENDDIKCALFFGNPIGHATVCIRASVLTENGVQYNPEFKRGQDYDLWDRLSVLTEFAAIPEIGLRYRVHDLQVGQVHSASQLAASETVMKRIAARLIPAATERDLALHFRFMTLAPEPSIASLEETAVWGRRLSDANKVSRAYPSALFDGYLGDKWLRTCSVLSFLGAAVWKEFDRSPLAEFAPAKRVSSLRLLIKSGLKLRGRSGLAQ
jgi:glycosyltransferase involved in cell wall biosynthesis